MSDEKMKALFKKGKKMFKKFMGGNCKSKGKNCGNCPMKNMMNMAKNMSPLCNMMKMFKC